MIKTNKTNINYNDWIYLDKSSKYMLIFTSFEISKHYLIISKSKQMLYLLCYDCVLLLLYSNSMLQINNKEKFFFIFDS